MRFVRVRAAILASTMAVALLMVLTGCGAGGQQGTPTTVPTETGPGVESPAANTPVAGETPAVVETIQAGEEKPTVPPGSGVITGLAPVESVEVNVMESDPVQVSALIKGYLPDACTELAEVSTVRDGSTIRVTLTTSRPSDLACADVIKPYEQTVQLDVAGAEPGQYEVVANNDKTATFTLP